MSDERCSFCGRDAGAVKLLVAANDAAICDRCVAQARASRYRAGLAECTFCRHTETCGHFAGAAATICVECIALAADVIAEHGKRSLPESRVVRLGKN